MQVPPHHPKLDHFSIETPGLGDAQLGVMQHDETIIQSHEEIWCAGNFPVLLHVVCLFPNRDLRSKEVCCLHYICLIFVGQFPTIINV